MKEENETLAEQAKSVFATLGEVAKILKEESASTEVTDKQAKQLEEDRCFHQWDFDYPVVVLAPLGLICVFLLSIVAQRHRSAGQRTCDAKIDMIVPLNVLTSYRNRTRFVVATSLIVYPCYKLLMAVAFPEITSATFLFAITRVCKIIVYGTVIYPIFVAINQKSLLASVIGCVMASVLLATSIIPLRLCSEFLDAYWMEIFARLPMMVSASLMALIFIYDSWYLFRRGSYLYCPDDETYDDFVSGKLLYVKELFKKPQKTETKPADVTGDNVVKRFLNNKQQRFMRLWKGHVGFKYPTRVLCTYTSLLVLMYYLIYQAVLFERETIGDIDRIVHTRVVKRLNGTRPASEFFAAVVHDGELSLNSTDDYLQMLSHGLTMLELSFYVSVAITAVVHLLMLASMMLNYRDNVILAYRGNFHHIMPRSKLPPANAVIGFTRYCGYQISFITYSFVFQWFAYAFVLFGLIQVVVLPIVFGYDTPILGLIARMWPTMLIASFLFISQIAVTRIVFVDTKDKKFEIVHRNAFFIWSYYLFLINALIGLLACLLRIFKAAGIAFLSMGRLDWCHLPGKFVTLDPGYLSYVGQIHIDSLHSNPIMLTFVHHVKLSLKLRNASGNGSSSHGGKDAKRSENLEKDALNSEIVELVPQSNGESREEKDRERDRRDRLVRRWFVAYSILKNPAIAHLRKRSSRITRNVSEHCLSMMAAHGKTHDAGEDFCCANDV